MSSETVPTFVRVWNGTRPVAFLRRSRKRKNSKWEYYAELREFSAPLHEVHARITELLTELEGFVWPEVSA